MTMAVDPAPVAARPSARAFPSSVLAGEECLPPSWDSHTSRGHTGEADCEVHRVLSHREASPSSQRKQSGESSFQVGGQAQWEPVMSLDLGSSCCCCRHKRSGRGWRGWRGAPLQRQDPEYCPTPFPFWDHFQGRRY